ncbi:hypothetical protein TRFO_31865 [Tritrichomonas foetus]|uniref:Uncharacterized protein n=1 Tax=Tritrichomonas foetus TaxID=1144522 RepID=A0A1J4JRE7_9EUKA|nr:hypothetical protein TRFO_31865 [Tritrichomonas foetus]|eukprot:OHT01322.1 hypothetical protein TRFO_31865 [Tritrichomonas foetus]
MYVSNNDKLNKRRSLKDLYTFHHVGGLAEDRIESRRIAEAAQIPPLTIKSDIKTKLKQLEHTEILTAPRFDPYELHKELQASSIRLLKIRNGMPLSQVVHEPGPTYQPLTPRRVNYADNKQILFPPREYVVPNLQRKSQYVLPPSEDESPATKAQNQLLRFKNQIYEADRKRFNANLEELNRRNRRRPHALSQQYEDYVKYGLKESQRRAERAACLSALKERRQEAWWPDFVNEFPKDGKSKRDLEYLEMLASVPTFNEETIFNLYTEAISKYKNAEPFKELLEKINQIGKYVQDYKLMMIVKKVESNHAKKMALMMQQQEENED